MSDIESGQRRHVFVPCEYERCRVNPCGEDCDYMAASILVGAIREMARRASLRRRPSGVVSARSANRSGVST